MMFLLLCLGMIALPTMGLEFAFEKLDQLYGFDVMESTLRVRKYNRTAIVLNGTLWVKIKMDNTFEVQMDMFHSRLGNQQFNHYPMKLPACGLCKFIDNVHESYPGVVPEFINYPKKGECPVTPRHVHVHDMIFPSEVMPQIMPQGLWKTVTTTKLSGVVRSIFELIVKAYNFED